MKKILKYMGAYKKESVLAPLFKLLEASFELIVPLVMAAIIDQGIRGRDYGLIWRMGGILVLLAAVGFASAVTAQYFAAKAAVGFSTKLRHVVFEHIQSLSFSKLDTVGTSTLITRMTSDINQVQSGTNLVLRLFLRSPFIVFGAMVMAFTVNVKAALVFVVTIPLLSIVVFAVMLVTIPMYKNVQNSLDKVLLHTRENLEGARVIRAFNKEAEEEAKFETDNSRLAVMQRVVGRISGLTNPLTFIIINCATIAVVMVGGNQVFGGTISQGEVVALVNYMSQILVELIKLANLIVQVTKAVASGNRIADVLDIPGRLEEESSKTEVGPDKNADAVSFENVSLCYEGASEESVSQLDFTIKKGQTVGIIGGTGSGKSTLVNLIPRFYDATKGAVKVYGVDVKDYPMEQLRQMVGVVMQKAVLFQGSIAENLRWGKEDATEEEMWKALEVAQATEVVEGKEGGLDYQIEQGGRNLSGGQKQRLTIARAVVKDPDILILDDSASALDFATDARLRAALSAMKGQKTIFIVSQRTSSIQFADKIIVMDDGQIAGIGTHNELLVKCDTYREIYESQFRKEDGRR